jgi:hypothetical protein
MHTTNHLHTIQKQIEKKIQHITKSIKFVKLPIETGHWLNITRHDRVCILCNNRNIGDEYHYLFECQFFAQKRKECLPKYFVNILRSQLNLYLAGR